MYYHPSVLDMYAQVRRQDDLHEVADYARAKQATGEATTSGRRWAFHLPALRFPRPAFARRNAATSARTASPHGVFQS